MLHYAENRDKKGKIINIRCLVKARNLLNTPELNKGNAFTEQEREDLDLQGALPDVIESLDEQCKRMYDQYCQFETNLEKNVCLNALNDRNTTLFYAQPGGWYGRAARAASCSGGSPPVGHGSAVGS